MKGNSATVMWGDLNLEYSGASMKDTSASLTLTVKHEPPNKSCKFFSDSNPANFNRDQLLRTDRCRFADA